MLSLVARCGLVLVCGMGLLFPEAGAEEKPKVKQVFVPLGGGTYLQAASKLQVVSAMSSDVNIVEARGKRSKLAVFKYTDAKGTPLTLQMSIGGTEDDPDTIYLDGYSLGKARLELKDKTGNTEEYEVHVRRELPLPVGGTLKLRRSDMGVIKEILSSAPKIVQLLPVQGDDKAIHVEAVAVGEATITLTDAKGKAETYAVIVRKPHITVAVGEKKRLQNSKKELLMRIRSEETGIIEVSPVPSDPRFIEVEAKAPGIAEVRLVDINKHVETIEVAVKPKAK